MEPNELTELHYITPISNIRTILEHGILSHNRAQRIQHNSVAMAEVQARRSEKNIPKGGKLHDYVNLYFTARNPMLFTLLKNSDEEICVLKISVDILELPQVVISDRNASADMVRFDTVEMGLQKLNWDLVFAENWTDNDPIEYWRKKSIKCAEVLVPDRVDPSYIIGSYVSDEKIKIKFDCLNTGLSCIITKHLFFVGNGD